MSPICSAAAQPGIVGGTFRVKRDRHRRSCPPLDFRYAPLATKLARHCNRSRRAVTGCEQSQQGGPLFDHFVSAGEQRRRYVEAERLQACGKRGADVRPDFNWKEGSS
jgi:hypothetical protein